MSYVPDELQRKINDVLDMARAVDGAIADLCERFTEVYHEYDTSEHPSLAPDDPDDPDDPDALDQDLYDSCGLDEASALLHAIAIRVHHASEADGINPHELRRYGLTGPPFDEYIAPWVERDLLLDDLQRVGLIMRTDNIAEGREADLWREWLEPGGDAS